MDQRQPAKSNHQVWSCKEDKDLDNDRESNCHDIFHVNLSVTWLCFHNQYDTNKSLRNCTTHYAILFNQSHVIDLLAL